jgi:hypothetical protein
VRIAWTKPLFAWDCLDDHPTLKTLALFLASVPDGKLLEALRCHRGRGRDDHPVHQLWGVVLLRVVLRHTSFAATLGELRRNEGLRRLVGVESEDDVPDDWNVSRFLVVLGTEPYLAMVHEIFDTMVGRLAEVVPDLGRHVAGDSTGLSARPGRAKEDNPDGLAEPAGGRKEYTDEEGKVVRVIEWFGYKLHLLADTRHEVAVAYQVGSTAEGDNEALPPLAKAAVANLREEDKDACRIRTVAYDKAADDEKVHEALAEHGIRPVIEIRALWKDEKERMLPGHDGTSNVVYDEAGTVYCYDKTQDRPVRHRMAYIGHEPARGTVKYRCPARHGSWRCPSDGRCNARKSYGKTVRIRCEEDLRRFPPIPRATKQFERLYKGRTAVERVNGRLKVFWGADDGNITGARRFHAQVGVVMIVHVGLATVLASAPRREGTLGRMRLTEVAKALRAKVGLTSAG